MGDYKYNASASGNQQSPHLHMNTDPKQAHGLNNASDPAIAAFQSQLDHLSQSQLYENYAQQRPNFNMAAMGQALPQLPPSPMHAHSQFGPNPSSSLQSQSMYQMQHQGYPGSGMDPAAIARAQHLQQAQYMYPPYNATQPPQQQGMRQTQMPPQYNVPGYYSFVGQLRVPQLADPRFAQTAPFVLSPGGDSSHYARRSSETIPIPSFPRGPPRKPKQSGHALWVGNLPPAARIEDLKDHFSRDATRDIESLFLISKSNCAFVNYRSEKACSDAMARFHDSRFHGVRLVCRLRRPTATDPTVGSSTEAAAEQETPSEAADSDGPTSERYSQSQDPDGPTIVGGDHLASPTAEKSVAVVGSDKTARHVPERYFIVKSLTIQDLESSMRIGIWATQDHNESLFNEAYQNADNVYLIFSVNKSGEYFGYARMASSIAGQPVNLNAREETTESPSEGTPHAIETPATATAPKGRIIDDSSRGSIFWEAILSKEDDAERSEIEKDEKGLETTPGSNWGRQFDVQWISTSRVPFYRTRGLRNPWNSQREVKIARDGTELEPSIGRRLVAMFHAPAGGPGSHSQGPQYR